MRGAKRGLLRASLTRPVPHLLQIIPPKTDVQLNAENTRCFEVCLQLDDTKFERISGIRVSQKKAKKRLIHSETSVIVWGDKTVVTIKICTLAISWDSRSRSSSTVFKRVLRAKKKNNKNKTQITTKKKHYREQIELRTKL